MRVAIKFPSNQNSPIGSEVWDWPVQREAVAEVAVVAEVLEHLQRHPPAVRTQILTPVGEQGRVPERSVCLAILALHRGLCGSQEDDR